MRFDAGTVTTTGQLENSTERVKVIEFHARSSNKESVVVGVSDVSANNGRELTPGEAVSFNFGLEKKEGSVEVNLFYVHIIGAGDKVDWTAIKE